jgi:hypothetical protein
VGVYLSNGLDHHCWFFLDDEMSRFYFFNNHVWRRLELIRQFFNAKHAIEGPWFGTGHEMHWDFDASHFFKHSMSASSFVDLVPEIHT